MGITTLESHATSFKKYMNCSSWFVRYNTIYIFYVSEYSTDISKYGNYPLVCPIATWLINAMTLRCNRCIIFCQNTPKDKIESEILGFS